MELLIRSCYCNSITILLGVFYFIEKSRIAIIINVTSKHIRKKEASNEASF